MGNIGEMCKRRKFDVLRPVTQEGPSAVWLVK